MVSNRALRIRYSLQLLTIFLAVERIVAVWQEGVHQKPFDISYIISLAADRHNEHIAEINASKPPSLLAHSMMPSSSPTTKLTTPNTRNEPSGSSPKVTMDPSPSPDACAETTDGSYGDTSTTKSIEVPYNYEVQYEKLLDGVNVNVDDVVNAVEVALSNSMLSPLFSNCGSATRRLANGIIIGLSAAPIDRATTNNCSSEMLDDEAECMVVEGALTLFLSDLNDIGSIIENTGSEIQNVMESRSLVSAHPSILSILHIDQQFTLLDIDDDQDDGNIIVDKIGPDDDNSMGRTAAIVSSVAAVATLLGVGLVYLRKRHGQSENNSDQRSQNNDSINLYDEATIGGSMHQ